MDKLLFHVVINSVRCEVYEREETHKLGELNGKPDNWWVKWYNTDMIAPKDLELINREELVEWIPWIDLGTNRPSWEIKISTSNRIAYKSHGPDIRSSGSVLIKCNNVIVYSFGAHNIEFAFAKAQYLIHIMSEHSFNFMNPESEIGRKIWYHDQPGIVSGLCLDDGCIYITYDGDGGFDMKHVHDEKDHVSDWQGLKTVRDDVMSPEIWWFRE